MKNLCIAQCPWKKLIEEPRHDSQNPFNIENNEKNEKRENKSFRLRYWSVSLCVRLQEKKEWKKHAIGTKNSIVGRVLIQDSNIIPSNKSSWVFYALDSIWSNLVTICAKINIHNSIKLNRERNRTMWTMSFYQENNNIYVHIIVLFTVGVPCILQSKTLTSYKNKTVEGHSIWFRIFSYSTFLINSIWFQWIFM